MFPVAVNKSLSCLPGHATTPYHPSPVPTIEKEPFQPWKGPGPVASHFRFLFTVLVPPLDPRLIPGREGLRGDNVFSLHSESCLCFVFVPDFFLGWPFAEGYNIQTGKWPSRKLESSSASWMFIQGCSQILFLNVRFLPRCTLATSDRWCHYTDSSSSQTLWLLASTSLAPWT